MKNKRSNRKRTAFFSPDNISTHIASAIDRDLEAATLVYGGTTGSFEFYKKSQKECTLKKYTPTMSNDKLASLAFDTFKATNVHMSNFTKGDLDLPDVKADTNLRSQILRSAKSICYNILSPLTEEEWFTRTKHSGGSSQGVSFIDTSLEAKFKLPISCNERVKSLVSRYLSFDLKLKDELYSVVTHGNETPRYTDANSSRATTVPKTDKIDRMIAIEPTWNMFFQQGLMLSMYDRMSDFGLDVGSLPTRHKSLAKASSITGLNSTIDFSSASDCVSYDLVKWLVPPQWFHRLDSVRSSHMLFPNGEVEVLNMFSTMGNAVTFPLETIIFYSLAVATVFQTGLLPGHKLNILPTVKSKREVSVFGDDCILPTRCANTFMEICESVGFLVNKEKSFFNKAGGFRESCGGDFLHGIDVRPFYLKSPTSNNLSALEPWLYIVCNGLLEKYLKHFGNLAYLYDKHAFKLIESLFDKHNLFLKIVPSYFPDDSGLKIGHDYERFLSCYSLFRCSKVAVGEHGSVTFNYCRFIYNNKCDISHGLRYTSKLKALMVSDLKYKYKRIEFGDPIKDTYSNQLKDLNFITDQEVEFRRRKNGGYVVSKAISPFWGAIANRKYEG